MEYCCNGFERTVPSGDNDERYVLVMQDHFTKFVVLVALRNKRSSLISHKVHKHLFCVFGAPKHIITDDGGEFKGEFAVLCKEWNVRHTETLPYHHQANGLAERYMQSLNKIVRIITEERQTTWPQALCMHAFAYNASFHSAIRNTPYFLNFGKDPHLPIDNVLNSGVTNTGVRLREFSRAKAMEMSTTISWTMDRLHESQIEMKRRYDAHQKETDIGIGDVVLVREEGVLPKSVMRWSEPYRVHALDKDGLEITIEPLFGKQIAKRVPIQRVRPYYPSELNPLSTQLTPAQESTIPPPVGRQTNLASTSSDDESDDEDLHEVVNCPANDLPVVEGLPEAVVVRVPTIPVEQGAVGQSRGSSCYADILNRHQQKQRLVCNLSWPIGDRPTRWSVMSQLYVKVRRGSHCLWFNVYYHYSL